MTSALSLVDIVENHLQRPQLNQKERHTLQQHRRHATTFTNQNPLAKNNVVVYKKQTMRSSRGETTSQGNTTVTWSLNLDEWMLLANPNKYLNDEVMMAYINDLATRTESKTKDGKNWFFMKSNLLDDQFNWRDMCEEKQEVKKRVQHRYRTLPISSFSTIIIPYNIVNTHWIIIKANMETDELTSYDGFDEDYHGQSNSPMNKCADLINHVLDIDGEPKKNFTFGKCSSVPKQTSGVDCCIIAALCAHAIIDGVDPNTFLGGGLPQIHNLRLRIAYEIIKKVDIARSYNTWLSQLRKDHLGESLRVLSVPIKPEVLENSDIIFQPVMTKTMQQAINKLPKDVAKEMRNLSTDIENVFNRVKAFEIALCRFCPNRNPKESPHLLPWIVTEFSIMVKSIHQLILDKFKARVCRDVFLVNPQSDRLIGFWKKVRKSRAPEVQVHKELVKNNRVMKTFGDAINDRLEYLEMDRKSITKHIGMMSINLDGNPIHGDVTGSLQGLQYHYQDFQNQPTILHTGGFVHHPYQWLLFHLHSMNSVYVMTERPVDANPAGKLIESAMKQFVEERHHDELFEVENVKKKAAAINVREEKSENGTMKKQSISSKKKRKVIRDLDEGEEDEDAFAGKTFVPSPTPGNKKVAVDASPQVQTRSSKKEHKSALKDPPVVTATNDTTSQNSSKKVKKAKTTTMGTRNRNNGRTNDSIVGSGSGSKEDDPGGDEESAKGNVIEHSGDGSKKQPCIYHWRQDQMQSLCALYSASAVVQDNTFMTADAKKVATTKGIDLIDLKRLLQKEDLYLKQLWSEEDSKTISDDTDNQAFIVLTQQNNSGGCHFHSLLKVDKEVWDLDSCNQFPQKQGHGKICGMILNSAKHDNKDSADNSEGTRYTVKNKDDHIIFLVVEGDENGSTYRPSWKTHQLPEAFPNLPILSSTIEGFNELRIWAINTLENQSQILHAAENTTATLNIIVPTFPGLEETATFRNVTPESWGMSLSDVVTSALHGMIHNYEWFFEMILSGRCCVHVSYGGSSDVYTLGWQTMNDFKVGLFEARNSVITCRIEYAEDNLSDVAIAREDVECLIGRRVAEEEWPDNEEADNEEAGQ